jgi:hypothetical protein
MKNLIIRVLFFILGRGLQSGSKHDPDIKRELESIPEGLRIQMKVSPCGGSMTVQKHEGTLRYRVGGPHEADLTIKFKNTESAFMVLTAQIGTPRGFAEHRIGVEGMLPYAMIFTRCVNILMGHLFPWFINKRIMKRLPPMPLRKQWIRLKIYALGVPFGK